MHARARGGGGGGQGEGRRACVFSSSFYPSVLFLLHLLTFYSLGAHVRACTRACVCARVRFTNIPRYTEIFLSCKLKTHQSIVLSFHMTFEMLNVPMPHVLECAMYVFLYFYLKKCVDFFIYFLNEKKNNSSLRLLSLV